MAKTLSKFIKPDAMIILDHLSAQYLLYLILGAMLSVEVLAICRLDTIKSASCNYLWHKYAIIHYKLNQ